MLDEIRKHKSSLILLSVISFIYVLPIILTGSYYIDDMVRSVKGNGWEQDGRFLPTYLMKAISPGLDVVDPYPFGQILSAVIVSFSGYLISYKATGNKGTSSVLSAFILTSSPFFLENLSYRYDSFMMGLSVLFICIPFLFYTNKFAFALSTSVFVAAAFQTYQATSISYFSVLAIFVTKDVLDMRNKDTLLLPIIAMICFCVGYYSSGLIVKYMNVDFYGRNELIFGSSDISLILHSKSESVKAVLGSVFTESSLKFYIPLFALSSLSIIALIYRQCKYSVMQGAYTLFIILACLVVCFIAFPGANLVLKETWWTARTFVGFGFFLLYLSIIMSFAWRFDIIQNISRALVIILSFVTCAAYSNALNDQNKLTTSVMSLANIETSKYENSDIIIDGVGPRSRKAVIIERNIPIMKFLVPNYLKNEWVWGINYAKSFDMIGVNSWIVGNLRNKYISEKCSFEVVQDNKFYTLRKRGKIFIMDFNKTHCN